jgi:hypothetical protein
MAREKPPIQHLEEAGRRTQAGISMKQERLIGRVIVGWSHLDAALGDAIWKILQIPLEDGRLFTTRADGRQKIQWLRTLSKRHGAGLDPAEFDRLLDTIDELREDRNFIAHGSWGTIQPDVEPAAMSLRPRTDPDRIVCETFPEARMREIIGHIGDCARGLKFWMAALDTSRAKSQRQSPL